MYALSYLRGVPTYLSHQRRDSLQMHLQLLATSFMSCTAHVPTALASICVTSTAA
jgi:hypothetical protein